ncbi:hypothetical protein Gorai_017809 [Gossypium raimondii]|uniref:Uncharacterized protein n=1 Tax=Gossypium raimondii TaxID=29730 RepID=A0A7J8PID4_GOSRA|nr:hypothetical protein [Gossypium raimondii]
MSIYQSPRNLYPLQCLRLPGLRRL